MPPRDVAGACAEVEPPEGFGVWFGALACDEVRAVGGASEDGLVAVGAFGFVGVAEARVGPVLGVRLACPGDGGVVALVLEEGFGCGGGGEAAAPWRVRGARVGVQHGGSLREGGGGLREGGEGDRACEEPEGAAVVGVDAGERHGWAGWRDSLGWGS